MIKITRPIFGVSAAFLGWFRFSHSRLLNQNEEREVKVSKCVIILSSAHYINFFKMSVLVDHLQQPLFTMILVSLTALWRHLLDTYLRHEFDALDVDKIFQMRYLLILVRPSRSRILKSERIRANLPCTNQIGTF